MHLIPLVGYRELRRPTAPSALIYTHSMLIAVIEELAVDHFIAEALR
jgi:hypothetical protein